MSSPSPYPYPTSSPSAPPFSFTPTPGSLTSVSPATISPQVYMSYISMPTYSASPIGLPISAQMGQQITILSRVSDDAFYGIICAIVFVILYTSLYANYYYNKYKKEKLRLKRFNELQGKVHSTVRAVLNPVYPA